MIDSGSDVTLINQKFIEPSTSCNEADILLLQGISSQPVATLGSTSIVLLGQPIKIHLVPHNFVLPHDGILGTDFFSKLGSTIDYKEKCIHYKNMCIPFAENTVIAAKP